MSEDSQSRPVVRCEWVRNDPLCRLYHDTEWGVPLHDDGRHFEFIVLDGMQAGLSWLTVLKKRPRFREAFARFDPRKVAAFDRRKIERLLLDPGLIRNRLKIEAAVKNARAFLAVQRAFGSFDAYVWSFVGGRPKINAWKTMRDIPAFTPDSEALSRDMKSRNFSFVGPTICYAYMQAAGLVNDHTVDCFRRRELM